MRVRSRQRFAAPFVLIVGCSSGGSPDRTAPPVAPIVAESSGEVAEPVPVPVAIDAGSPATPPDRDNPKAPVFDPCKAPPDPKNPPCNPPSPRAFEARIASQQITDGALTVTIRVGEDRGIYKRWRGELLDRRGDVIPTASSEIVSVAGSSTEIRFPKRTELAPRDARVRMSPP